MEGFKVLVEGSAHHMHVTQEDLLTLFGPDAALVPKKMLSQPGEFQSEYRVEIVGPKGKISRVSVLGPCRKNTQVEVSFSDARILGLNPPIRESGDVKGSEGCSIIGPAGTLELKEGVIIAKRHLHMTPEDGAKAGIEDGETVLLRVEGPRALIFDEVFARVKPYYATAVHIDYDELNAGAVFDSPAYGVVFKKN